MAAVNDVIDLSIEDGVAVITSNHPPVNALSAIVRDGLTAAFDRAIADDAVQAVVLTCAGRTFFAGADISEFGKPPKGASLHALFDKMESASKPIVAAIHGTSLGGGFETALVCHYRVAVPSARVGLPEVKLGLLAGAGGTQRLPRIVGAAKALEMVTGGAPVGGKAALAMGLVDELVSEGADLRAAGIAFARKVLAEKRPLKKVRDLQVAGATPELFAEFRAKNAKAFRGFEAPEASIKCIEAAANLPFDEGKKFEREEFTKLVAGVQSQAQRYMFFAERQAAKIEGLPEGTATRPVKKVGMIGAGTMGGGIAMNFLNKGIPVTIVETQAGGAGARHRDDPQELREHRRQGPHDAGRRGKAHGGAVADAGPGGAGRLRPDHRGRVREHGDQEGAVRQARQDRQAGRDPGVEHQLPERRRDRLGDAAARRTWSACTSSAPPT